MAFWKGEGGYRDLREYLDIAEGLWLRGDTSIPGQPGTYYRFAPGLPILSGPLVLLGAALHEIVPSITPRALGALTVPLLGALSCALLYGIARMLKCSARAGLWASVLLGLGSPLLTYAKLYYAETAVLFCLALALYAWLRAEASVRAWPWTLLAGASLASAVACKYEHLLLVAPLAAGMAIALLKSEDRPGHTKGTAFVAFATVPMLAAAALLWMNYAHFGHPLRTGYEDVAERNLSPSHAPGNLLYLGQWLMRVPWLLPAFFLLPRALKGRRALWWGLALGLLAMEGLWLSFASLSIFPIKYTLPMLAPLAVGLCGLGNLLEARGPRRGLVYTGLAIVLWNLGFFLTGDDGSAAFTLDAAHGLQSYVWYSAPDGDDYGSPAGAEQLAILAVLLAAGSAGLWRAAARTRDAGGSRRDGP
ncbi:MAG: phospholipid carrier-dependent glycosyltransferase [Planctomycetes bacterium]|nr:phospholipid carrier-dependent glycosyltransferase [Planctomycetota bacterium]